MNQRTSIQTLEPWRSVVPERKGGSCGSSREFELFNMQTTVFSVFFFGEFLLEKTTFD